MVLALEIIEPFFTYGQSNSVHILIFLLIAWGYCWQQQDSQPCPSFSVIARISRSLANWLLVSSYFLPGPLQAREGKGQELISTELCWPWHREPSVPSRGSSTRLCTQQRAATHPGRGCLFLVRVPLLPGPAGPSAPPRSPLVPRALTAPLAVGRGRDAAPWAAEGRHNHSLCTPASPSLCLPGLGSLAGAAGRAGLAASILPPRPLPGLCRSSSPRSAPNERIPAHPGSPKPSKYPVTVVMEIRKCVCLSFLSAGLRVPSGLYIRKPLAALMREQLSLGGWDSRWAAATFPRRAGAEGRVPQFNVSGFFKPEKVKMFTAN